jgi:thioredoxin 1
MIKQTSDAEFVKEISHGLTLVDFYADWCGPCKMLTPVIEELAEKRAKELKVLKVNVDHCQQTARTFGITSIPTVILFKEGKEAGRVVGLQDFDEMSDFIDQNK